MKKVIVLIMAISLLLVMIVSCDKKHGASNEYLSPNVKSSTGSQENANKAVNQQSEKRSGNSGSIYKTPGKEFSDYFEALNNPEKSFDTIITKDEVISSDMDALEPGMFRLIPVGALASLAGYEELKDGVQGKLPLSGYEATKEKKGNEIIFKASHAYTQGEGRRQTGDKYRQNGVLNTSTNALSFETVVESEGNPVERIVCESRILPDGTCTFQYLTVSKAAGVRASDKATKLAVFKRYDKTSYTAIVATFDSQFDFTYDSILGKNNITAEEMAKKYKINGKFTVKGGKAAFEKGQ